jgi:hypothetical protein
LETLETDVVGALKRRDTGAADGDKVSEEQSAPGHTSVSLFNLRRRDGGGGLGTVVSEALAGGGIDPTDMSGGSTQSNLLRRKVQDNTGSNGGSDQQKTAPSGGHTDVSLLSLRRRGAGLVGGGGDLSSKFLGDGGEKASQQSGSTVSLVNLRRRSSDKAVDDDGQPDPAQGSDGITIGAGESITGDSANANVGGLKVRRSSRRRVSRFSRRSGNNNANQVSP